MPIQIPLCPDCGDILVYVNPNNEFLKRCQKCNKQYSFWLSHEIKISHDLNEFFMKLDKEKNPKKILTSDYLFEKIKEYSDDCKKEKEEEDEN